MPAAPPDLICFSHLRWDHVFQRPHHLMSRASRDRRVFFVEEPLPGRRPRYEVSRRGGVTVLAPRIPDVPQPQRSRMLRGLLDGLIRREGIDHPTLWYYAPLMLPWTRHVDPHVVVFDAMDELTAFREAPPGLRVRERQLIEVADVVFTGGHSLFRAKRQLHPDVHPFPSAVDAEHFRRARVAQPDPLDQAGIPHPRLGYFGVLDERIDFELVDAIAARRPDWSIVLVGPTAKIEADEIPQRPNIHQVGQKPYEDLPAYLAGWDVALMPFALNESTAFISPTKTPEYLAGGRPVVSTSVADVVSPYGERGLVRIADDAAGFIAAIEEAMVEPRNRRLVAVDAFLDGMSWDTTWADMDALAERAARRRALRRRGVVVEMPVPAVRPPAAPLRTPSSRTLAQPVPLRPAPAPVQLRGVQLDAAASSGARGRAAR